MQIHLLVEHSKNEKTQMWLEMYCDGFRPNLHLYFEHFINYTPAVTDGTSVSDISSASALGTGINSPRSSDAHTQIARFMGPTWEPPGTDSTQVGPMLVPWTLLSGYASLNYAIIGSHHGLSRFSLNEVNLKMPSEKCRPFCLCLKVLTSWGLHLYVCR